jgi:hypothetical protein
MDSDTTPSGMPETYFFLVICMRQQHNQSTSIISAYSLLVDCFSFVDRRNVIFQLLISIIETNVETFKLCIS